MFCATHLQQFTYLALLSLVGRVAYNLYRRNRDLEGRINGQVHEINNQAHEIQRLERALIEQPAPIREELRLVKERLCSTKHELNKKMVDLAFVRTEASEKERNAALTIERVEDTNEQLKEKIELLKAISTLNGSGMNPWTLEVNGYKERVDGALATWMDVYNKWEETKKELETSKAATSNVRKALSLGLRPGSPTIFEGVKKREELRMQATLFDVSVKCELFAGQLKEERVARRAADQEALLAKHNEEAARVAAEEAREESRAAQAARRVAEEEKADLAMELELAHTETDVLRSWVDTLAAPRGRSASTTGKVDGLKKNDVDVGKLRASSSLPNMMISLARLQRAVLEEKETVVMVAPLASPRKLEIRRKVSAIPSIPTSMSISFSLSDLADDSDDEDKENALGLC